MNRPCSASAADTWVPLISASPSLAASTTGAMPAASSAARASTSWPATRTWPTPSSASVMCANGARSPEAPTEPLAGIAGMMPALTSAIKVSTITGRTPEKPRARLATFISMIKRSTGSASNAPVPTACETIRLRCNCSSCWSGMRVLARMPKPVLMPYAASPLATIARTAAADAAIAGQAPAASVSGTGAAHTARSSASVSAPGIKLQPGCEGVIILVESPSASQAGCVRRRRLRPRSRHRHGASRPSRCR